MFVFNHEPLFQWYTDIKESNEIGPQHLGSAAGSFLNSGFNLGIWQSVGKSEYFMESLHISEIDFARIFATSFKIFLEISSIPAALSLFISSSNSGSRPSVTFENVHLEENRPKIYW